MDPISPDIINATTGLLGEAEMFLRSLLVPWRLYQVAGIIGILCLSLLLRRVLSARFMDWVRGKKSLFHDATSADCCIGPAADKDRVLDPRLGKRRHNAADHLSAAPTYHRHRRPYRIGLADHQSGRTGDPQPQPVTTGAPGRGC